MRRNNCRRSGRHEYDDLCFCPEDPSDVRRLLAQPFINSWVGEQWYREAKRLANDPAATQEQLDVLLAKIEESANDCYGMWRQTI